MRLRKQIITMLVVAIIGLVAFVGVPSKSPAPIIANIVNVTEVEDIKRVTVEFRRHDPIARFSEPYQVQARIFGRWLPQVSFSAFEHGYVLVRTNCEQLVFDFPRQTEACKFSFGYRRGPKPYCQAYFFLSRHGISQKFPAMSHAILKFVPRQPRLRHVECEFEIPRATHTRLTDADAGILYLGPSVSICGLFDLGSPRRSPSLDVGRMTRL